MNCKMVKHILYLRAPIAVRISAFPFLLCHPFKDIRIPTVPRVMIQFVAICQELARAGAWHAVSPFGQFLKPPSTRPSRCGTHLKSPPYYRISFPFVCTCVASSCVFVCECLYLCMHMWKPNDASVFLSGFFLK